MSQFSLDPQIERDTYFIGDLALSRVVLMNDCRYPWLILVPRVRGVKEIFELSAEDQVRLIQESSYLASKMSQLFIPKKMNIAAIGNKVSQLHIHHVARSEVDAVWPEPVWGRGSALRYSEESLNHRISLLRCALFDSSFDPNMMS